MADHKLVYAACRRVGPRRPVEGLIGRDNYGSGRPRSIGATVRDVVLMVPVVCIGGLAVYTTIQRLERTTKAARWQPAADVEIVTVQGHFDGSFNPSARRPIRFTTTDGKTIALDCYASRGIYSVSNLNTCLPMLNAGLLPQDAIYTVKYYINIYDKGDSFESVILRVNDNREVLFEQSISDSALPR